MTFTTPIDARDEMFTLFEAGFEPAVVPAILATAPVILWQGKPDPKTPLEGYNVRVSTKGAGTELAAFMDRDKIYDTYGNLFVQVQAPIGAEDSYRKGELIAIACRDIFRGVETPGGVWFRNMRYVELDDDGKFYRWKVTVEFEFSER